MAFRWGGLAHHPPLTSAVPMCYSTPDREAGLLNWVTTAQPTIRPSCRQWALAVLCMLPLKQEGQRSKDQRWTCTAMVYSYWRCAPALSQTLMTSQPSSKQCTTGDSRSVSWECWPVSALTRAGIRGFT